MSINKKGFTLVELLAVIVILAVVMLIGVTAILPLMGRARKSALGSEGIALVDTAKTAYQAEQLSSKSPIKSTSSVCFSIAWLKANDYYDKDSDDYKGSVLVTYDSGKYSYKFWIDNGTYYIAAADTNSFDSEKDVRDIDDIAAASNPNTCGMASVTGIVNCTGTGACS